MKEMAFNDETTARYWLAKVMNGGIAGVVGVTAVFPVDLIKTRLQNQQPGPDGKLLYRNMVDCFKQVLFKEGPRALYRGLAVNATLITPEKAIKLVCNDMFRYLYRNEKGALTLPREALAGASAGMCQIVVTTPMELLKIQQQDAGRSAMLGARQRTQGAFKMAINLIKEKGYAGIYRGNMATFIRDVNFSAIYFPLFAHFNAMGKRRQGSNEAVFYHTFCSGIGAGAVASLAVNPFDVIKTRLQTITIGKTDKTYDGYLDCAKKIYQTEGVLAFYKGGLLRISVIAPLFGIAQTVYFFGISEAMLHRLLD